MQKDRLDIATGKLLSKVQPDEPSAEFTGNIMQMILTQPDVEVKAKSALYWWLLLLLPLAGIIWQLVYPVPAVTMVLTNTWKLAAGLFSSLFDAFKSLVEPLAGFHISPVYMGAVFALLFLIIADQLLGKSKHSTVS